MFVIKLSVTVPWRKHACLMIYSIVHVKILILVSSLDKCVYESCWHYRYSPSFLKLQLDVYCARLIEVITDDGCIFCFILPFINIAQKHQKYNIMAVWLDYPIWLSFMLTDLKVIWLINNAIFYSQICEFKLELLVFNLSKISKKY